MLKQWLKKYYYIKRLINMTEAPQAPPQSGRALRTPDLAPTPVRRAALVVPVGADAAKPLEEAAAKPAEVAKPVEAKLTAEQQIAAQQAELTMMADPAMLAKYPDLGRLALQVLASRGDIAEVCQKHAATLKAEAGNDPAKMAFALDLEMAGIGAKVGQLQNQALTKELSPTEKAQLNALSQRLVNLETQRISGNVELMVKSPDGSGTEKETRKMDFSKVEGNQMLTVAASFGLTAEELKADDYLGTVLTRVETAVGDREARTQMLSTLTKSGMYDEQVLKDFSTILNQLGHQKQFNKIGKIVGKGSLFTALMMLLMGLGFKKTAQGGSPQG